MQIATRSIALVVDEDFGSRLLSLASRTRVWAVDSAPNRRFAERLADRSRGAGAVPRVVLVERTTGASLAEHCVNMLYLVEERYGAHRSNPAYGEIEVIGVGTGEVEGVRQELDRLGFSGFEQTCDRLRAYRRTAAVR